MRQGIRYIISALIVFTVSFCCAYYLIPVEYKVYLKHMVLFCLVPGFLAGKIISDKYGGNLKILIRAGFAFLVVFAVSWTVANSTVDFDMYFARNMAGGIVAAIIGFVLSSVSAKRVTHDQTRKPDESALRK